MESLRDHAGLWLLRGAVVANLYMGWWVSRVLFFGARRLFRF